MIKKIVPAALIAALAIGNIGCNSNSGFKKLNGIQYKIVKDAHGKKPKSGEVVEMNVVAKEDTTTLMNSALQAGGPVPFRVQDHFQNGDFQNVITVMGVGDSAVVEILCDTLLKQIPPQQKQLPPWLKKGNKIVVTIGMVSVSSMDDFKKKMEAKQEQARKEMEEKAAAQLPMDDKMLQDYFAKNNLKPTKTASGLYYSITKPGSGPQITAGQSVTMNYTGKTLDGKTFDSNMDDEFHHKQPFSFLVGRGQVIRGWDEGVMLLKKGSKATFYVPSPLAYGPTGNPPAIAPNTVLTFDVEVVDAKAAPAGGANAAPAPEQ
jgi:FKBP-type peptidyl-prolyl cis-trans isomerase FkpA